MTQGAIAASAPVRAFASRLNPTFVPSAFWQVSVPPGMGNANGSVRLLGCLQKAWTLCL